ncbi:hypothetical protein MUK42_28608 [Musa troglodytarum]|uniref:Uncharacterized protein n=1 Tax=Musa troglodytarum TaxID=320322 RepID=A0A9E7G6D3_9LILI|nr:hypothetical protein MUK42_28608 [Musa troglodytarum]
MVPLASVFVRLLHRARLKSCNPLRHLKKKFLFDPSPFPPLPGDLFVERTEGFEKGKDYGSFMSTHRE